MAEDSDSIADKTLILPSTILIDEQLKNGINSSGPPSQVRKRVDMLPRNSD